MNVCDNFKDLILTGYFDQEIDEGTKKKVDAHLVSCAQCRNFAAEVKQNLIAPFQEVVREEVPRHLWSAIEEKIKSEEVSPEEREENVLTRMARAFVFPRLVPVLASILIGIFAVSIFFNPQKQIKQAPTQEQAQYLANLVSTDDVREVEKAVSETPIETYFL